MAKTTFEDGNLLTKLPGTRVMAAWLNKVFAHRHDGRDQDGSSILDYGVDTGAANALVVAMTPPFEVQTVGLPFTVRVAHTNAGPAVLALDAFGGAAIHKLGGLELGEGDLQEGQIIQLAWDGEVYQLLSYNSPPVTDAVTLQGQGAGMLAPPGALVAFAMPTVPAGWLPCDGRAVLRSQYPALYAAIGSTWGAGDNVSTFNLPDLRGEFVRGWDNGRGIDPDREMASWQADGLKAHAHPQKAGAKDADWGQQPGDPTEGLGHMSGSNDSRLVLANPVTTQDSTGTTGGTETRPRNAAALYCIKF